MQESTAQLMIPRPGTNNVLPPTAICGEVLVMTSTGAKPAKGTLHSRRSEARSHKPIGTPRN